MILNIFILILAVEIIAKRPPERPPDGGPIIRYPDGVDPDGPRMPGGPQGTKKLIIGPNGCIRPRPGVPVIPRPLGPKGQKGPKRPGGMRMRWLPCSLDSCVVR